MSGAYEMKIAPCEWPLAVWLHILSDLGLKCCTVNPNKRTLFPKGRRDRRHILIYGRDVSSVLSFLCKLGKPNHGNPPGSL